MTESMIERLARATRSYRWSLMCHGSPETGVRKYHVFGPDGEDWRDATEALFETEAEAQAYVDRMNVRAVLNTLKEPDEGMVEAALEAWRQAPANASKRQLIVAEHQAAISHILKESDSNG